LGSGMVMIPWAIIHLLLGNTTLAWQIGLLYIILAIVRQVAEPFITGKEIGIRPLYTFAATVICILLFGPIGAVLGAVVAVVIKAVFDVSGVNRRKDDHFR
jgi:predicted PurR-regulated permease PerM